MFRVDAIATVHNARVEVADDGWGPLRSTLTLVDAYGPEALAGLDAFSHVEVIFLFDRVDPASVCVGARRPRGNPAWPEVGIFAQRGKSRPNRLGATVCRVVGVDARVLTVEGLDAVDGTPVLDLKPVMRGFLPGGAEAVTEPAWATELMAGYWRAP